MKKLSLALLLITLLSFQFSDQRSIYLLPKVSSGVTAADYDMDGDIDIITNHLIDSQTNWGGTHILENNGYGEFIFQDSIYDTVGWYSKVGYLTHQAYPDIVSEARDSIQIISNDGASRWINKYYVGPGVNDFDLGDINNDGLLDIVFCSFGFGYKYWGVLINDEGSKFDEPTYFESDFPISSILCEDLNNDSVNDVVLIGSGSRILINQDTTFNEILLEVPASDALIYDIDNNGDKDIITYADILSIGKFSIILNESVKFDSVIEFMTPFICTGFSITDVNHDSLPDFILQNHSGTNPGYHIYYNLGDFQFIDSSFVPAEWMGETRRFMDCADIDGNGYDDIILSRQVYSGEMEFSPLEIFFNDGNGNFVENPQTSISESFTTNELLLTCYPNPFTTSTTIEYNLNLPFEVTLSIFNNHGKQVDLIRKHQQSGKQSITWQPNGLPPGLYYFTLQAGEEVTSGKLIIAD